MTIAIPIPRLTPVREVSFCHLCRDYHAGGDAGRCYEATEGDRSDLDDDRSQSESDV